MAADAVDKTALRRMRRKGGTRAGAGAREERQPGLHRK
jgi:hypothetical protein